MVTNESDLPALLMDEHDHFARLIEIASRLPLLPVWPDELAVRDAAVDEARPDQASADRFARAAGSRRRNAASNWETSKSWTPQTTTPLPRKPCSSHIRARSAGS
ncbi:hypothetical protein BN2476_1550007 [Paraburkholderia piptadeniae]|uniref:Uncharacterized protein n=1 Tax=Paraburkholderia piptadeniae TaxID=1701573 RepID=A0A1N7SX65_9BURK|nr:hypothetical protein BN2476_1550007 [Paraburkholderia piptadeniae]